MEPGKDESDTIPPLQPNDKPCGCDQDAIINGAYQYVSNNFNTLIDTHSEDIYNYISGNIELFVSKYISDNVKQCDCESHIICPACEMISARVAHLENLISQLHQLAVENVTISLAPPTGGTNIATTAAGIDDYSNTVAFDTLLADVAEYTHDDLDGFYNDYISPVVAINDYNLLSPIPVTAFNRCEKLPSSGKATTWDDIAEDSAGDEMKRAYIMQFILANRSNQTRAIYLTNQLTGSLTLPIRDDA